MNLISLKFFRDLPDVAASRATVRFRSHVWEPSSACRNGTRPADQR